MKKIEEEKVDKIFEMYDAACKLKVLPRSGWLKWKLAENVRCESVAEHVYGSLMLALAIFSNVQIEDVDIQKVFVMLSIHETEEIFIGDITPYDVASATKKEQGAQAVEKFFDGAENSSFFKQIIAEFEKNETKEAKFAHEIDKLEAELQAKRYDDKLDSHNSALWNDEEILKFRESGDTKVSQFFVHHDKKIYDELFLQLSENIDKMDKNRKF